MLVQFPAWNACLVQHRTKILEKWQPQTSERRYCKGKLKTDQFIIWIRNVNYTLEFRGVFRTQSKIYEGAFLLTLKFTKIMQHGLMKTWWLLLIASFAALLVTQVHTVRSCPTSKNLNDLNCQKSNSTFSEVSKKHISCSIMEKTIDCYPFSQMNGFSFVTVCISKMYR